MDASSAGTDEGWYYALKFVEPENVNFELLQSVKIRNAIGKR